MLGVRKRLWACLGFSAKIPPNTKPPSRYMQKNQINLHFLLANKHILKRACKAHA